MPNYGHLSGNVKKCAVGKHPKSEKHGNTAQFSEVERSGTQENCGGIGSGCRLRLRPLPVLRRRQSQRVARIDPNAVVVDTTLALRSAPTPTSHGRCSKRQQRKWAASWHRSDKSRRQAEHRKGSNFSPVLFHPFRAFPLVGHGVGQAVDPHFDPHHFQRFCNKKASKTEVFDAFWSWWCDSNT